jgi:hypothetical protein
MSLRMFVVLCLLSLAPSTVFGQLLGSRGPSQEEVAARVLELTEEKPTLPDDPSLLLPLYSRIEDEISSYRRMLPARKEDEAAPVAEARAKAAKAFEQLDGLDCAAANNDNVSHIRRELLEARDAIDQLVFFNDLEPKDEWRHYDGDDVVAKTCDQMKQQFGGPAKHAEFLEIFDAVKKVLDDKAKETEAFRKNLEKAIELLQLRKAAVQKALDEAGTKEDLSESLWAVILVIGIFSVAAILSVKQFSERIQLEWVASGQVIQFVTVMILLSVIMALGLTDVLKENTLGTLLGGIGGYVLAQGVGRAAAREVSRERNSSRHSQQDAAMIEAERREAEKRERERFEAEKKKAAQQGGNG